MLWVGIDTHYSLHDPGYREKSLGMDTVGNSASTLYQQISSILLCPSGLRGIDGSQTTTKNEKIFGGRTTVQERQRSSPTLSEPALQEAIVRALNKFNDEDTSTYLTLMKATIGEAIGANGGSDEIDLLERRIDALNNRMLKMVSDSVERGADMEENADEFKTISDQIEQLNRRIEAIRKSEGSDEERQERLNLIQATIDQREAHRDTYDDAIVRQMIECVKVHEGGRLTIIFGGGYEIGEQI